MILTFHEIMAVAIENGYGLAFSIDCGDVRVHLDHAFFLFDSLVSSFHQAVHPILEWLSHQGVDHIGYVLPRELVYFSTAGRKGICDLIVILVEIEHGLDFQALELGHGDVLCIGPFDDLFGAGREIPEVPDGDALIVRQIGTAIGGDEPVHLFLARVFGREFLRSDKDLWSALIVDLVLVVRLHWY